MANGRPLFGAAYYDEYMPEERLEKDVEMMKAAGISVVRIGESTWSTIERSEGRFDFSSLDRVVEAMGRAGIGVIVGTATYAIPAWLARTCPEILVETPQGRRKFGARQNMDIAHPAFLFHAERIIRAVVGRYAPYPAVIGFQADNETKHYGNVGAAAQARFVSYLREKFGSTDRLNEAFGLDYWSDRVDSWEDFPAVEGSINASLSCEYSAFQRHMVSEYLAWQVAIIEEYKRPDQFVTHNFDFEWRGYSYGIQGDVDHAEASRAFDLVGIDVYHPSQDLLTGREIAFAGDVARSLKRQNYLVMETQAQGFPEWLPYPGQLRLQAFSHLASGASMVEYWHWHSIHNAIETYWKGLLSHDLEANPTYEEAASVGRDFERLGDRLILREKRNALAFVVSNRALSAFDSFKQVFGTTYNDVFRRFYDAVYDLNVECDVVFDSPDLASEISRYDCVVVPALYAVSDATLLALEDYVKRGGHLAATFLCGFCDEFAKVRAMPQPAFLSRALGVRVRRFTKGGDGLVDGFMELVEAEGAKALVRYGQPQWGEYAALSLNDYGSGQAAYIGCMPTRDFAATFMRRLLSAFGLYDEGRDGAFPLVRKSGVNGRGKAVRYYLNYSGAPLSFDYAGFGGMELLSDEFVAKGASVELAAWGVAIIEEA